MNIKPQSYYEVTLVPTGNIDPFSHQARKIFHDRDLGTLLDSIRELGITQPLIARASATNIQRLELVAGERRLRAAKELGLKMVPVMVRTLTDQQAEEESLVENLGRVNLTPVEEANAFKRMMELTNGAGERIYTVEALAKKIGREPWEITTGLKVLNAPESLLKEIDMAKGERSISVDVVALIGRIPDPKARELAAADVLKGARVEGGAPTGKPLTTAETRKLVRTRYMAKIDLTEKEREDETLVPLKTTTIRGVEERVQGGRCEDCCFRSGCMSDIADLLQEGSKGAKGGQKGGVDPNICTKPACLQMKRDVLWNRKCDQHLKDGGRVMSAAEAKKEFRWQEYLIHGSAYAKLADKPDYSVFRKYDIGTWAQLIKGLSVIVTLARVPETGKEVKLINIKEAAELVKSRWKEEPSDSDSKEAAASKAARAKELKAEKVDKEFVNIGLRRIEEVITKTGLAIDQWPELFDIVLDNSGSDGQAILGKWLNIQLPKNSVTSGRSYNEAIKNAAALKATTANGWLAWCVLSSIARGIKYGGAGASDFTTIIDVLEIDRKEIKAEATKTVDEKQKPAKPKKDKPKGPLKPGEKGVKAGAYDTGDSGAKVATPGARTEPTKENRFSAEEAITGLQASRFGKDPSPVDVIAFGAKEAAAIRAKAKARTEPEKVYDAGEESDEDLDPVMDIVNRKRAAAGKKPMTKPEARAALNAKIDDMEHDWQAEWDALPKKPSRDNPEDLKPWDAARKRIKRGAAKDGVILKTKGE